jgi:CheY-like chemotaxis protein
VSNKKADGVATVRTILVVEDQVIVRMVIAAYLRDCGYRVVEAVHAAEALDILNQPEISIDLVFVSVELPGTMNGFQLAGWIRENLPKVQIVFATNAKRASKKAAELCEEGPFVAKPYQPQAVVDQIQRLLGVSAPRLDQ